MVLRHDNHPFMKFIPIIMTLLVRRWHSVQRLGKDISFHIKGLFQKNLEWYHFNLCIWIFLISCMHFSCSLSPLSLFHKFKCFLWSCWLLRLLVIKVKVGLLILGFAILDGLMVNLSFLMERSAFHHLSCLTVFSIHYVFLEHVLYFFFSFFLKCALIVLCTFNEILQYIKGGPVVGFVYWAPELHFLVFFNRLRLQE